MKKYRRDRSLRVLRACTYTAIVMTSLPHHVQPKFSARGQRLLDSYLGGGCNWKEDEVVMTLWKEDLPSTVKEEGALTRKVRYSVDVQHADCIDNRSFDVTQIRTTTRNSCSHQIDWMRWKRMCYGYRDVNRCQTPKVSRVDRVGRGGQDCKHGDRVISGLDWVPVKVPQSGVGEVSGQSLCGLLRGLG
jgi:hypothetical protein